MVEVVVGQEFVDGHVDEFVVSVVNEFEASTGDGVVACDCPHPELLGLPGGGFKVLEQFAQFSDGLLAVEIEFTEGALSSYRGELLGRRVLDVDQSSLVEDVDRVVDTGAWHVPTAAISVAVPAPSRRRVTNV